MNKQKNIKQNKILVNKYPFLLPRNVWTGEVPDNYDYSYTELDDMPEGWRIAFGESFLEELKTALGDYAPNYRISQIKEKWGGLRWYDFGRTEEAEKIISKYEQLSETICIVCGKPAVAMTAGWIVPVCAEHLEGKQPYCWLNNENENK